MIVLLPLPVVEVIPTETKEGSKNSPQYAATIRSFGDPIRFVNRDGDTVATEQQGNRNPHHDLRLSAEQYAEWTRVTAILSDPKNSERKALVEAITAAGGITLPNGGGGRAAKRGTAVDLSTLLG